MRLSPLLAVFLIPLVGSATTVQAQSRSQKVGEKTGLTVLPQQHEYQRELRTYLATLTEKDFTHGVSDKLSDRPTGNDPEYLYRNYLLTLMHQPLVGTKRGYPSVNAPARLFLLASIETPQGIMAPPVWPETLMSFVHWDYPGNPYFQNRALKFRAFVSATVLMVMLDDTFENVPPLRRPDLFSYQLVYFALSYRGFKEVLPPAVCRSYETGLKRMAEWMLKEGIRAESPHNDVIVPFGLSCVSMVLRDAALARAIEEYSRKLYTDPRYFNPAGYWNFRGGIDMPFNGLANFFSAATALTADWPFVREVLDRTYRLRGHLILPEPDGKWTGPSHFNARVSGPASIDQWAWDGARDSAAAMITDEAAHLIKLPGEEVLRRAPAARAKTFAEHLRENPVNPKGGFLKDEELTSWHWAPRIWATYNFPATVNPGYEFYRPGAFARRQELEKKNSPLLRSPFERGESFLRAFEKSFVVTRQPGFAAILHTGPIGTQDPSESLHQFPGPMGLSGGQLSAFWTPAAGCVLLGQRGGMTHDKSFDRVEDWRIWPNHSVNGLTADGVFFTSAGVRKPEVAIDVNGAKGTVKVAGTLPPSIVGQEKAIRGKYNYARTFHLDGKGVSVTTSISGDGTEALAELVETLPVYLRDVREQPKAEPTTIEFLVDDRWSHATDRPTAHVRAVRLTRFTGAVQVTFDRPRRVRLSPSDWSDTFLSRGTARNVMIDLLENNDRPTSLKTTREVSYRIEACKVSR